MSTVVDVDVPRFNQLCVAVFTGLAFVLQLWWVVPVVAVLLAATRFGGPRFGLFTQAYLRLVKPRRKGPTMTEPADPPRFAQLLGIIFLAVATVAFIAGFVVAGWVVTLMVTALAALAAATRICVGCMLYERAVG